MRSVIMFSKYIDTLEFDQGYKEIYSMKYGNDDK